MLSSFFKTSRPTSFCCQQELQEKIRHQEPVFDQLMKNGSSLLESAEPGAEKDELEAKLADVEKRWNDIKHNTAEHEARVNSALPEAVKYNESASSLGPWLKETEEKLASLEPIVASKDTVEKLNNTVRLIREDIDKHRPERDAVSEKSEAVIELSETDGDIVKSEAQDAVERYDELYAAFATEEKELQDVLQLLDQYNDLMEPVDRTVEKVDSALESQGPISADVAKNKEDLDNIKVALNFFLSYPNVSQIYCVIEIMYNRGSY